MRKRSSVVVGIDIGTTKICTFVAERVKGALDIIGIGQYASLGLRKGVIIDVQKASDSIRESIIKAEHMAGISIDSAYVSIGGNHIKGFKSRASVSLRNKEVSLEDMERVVGEASMVPLGDGREILHIIPQYFSIDGQAGIRIPLGMAGRRLEVDTYIITGSSSAVQNVKKCCRLAGLNVTGLVLQPLASSEAVLFDEEKELGVVLVDMGGGTSDFMILHEGTLKYVSVLAVGGMHITNDIAVAFKVGNLEAERLKIEHGCAFADLLQEDEAIEVKLVSNRGDRTITQKSLSKIIEARVEEILQVIRKGIKSSNLEGLMASGLVFVGGSSLLYGIQEFSSEIIGLPPRLGLPGQRIGGLVDLVRNPSYATGVGLLLYADKCDKKSKHKFKNFNVFMKVLKHLFLRKNYHEK